MKKIKKLIKAYFSKRRYKQKITTSIIRIQYSYLRIKELRGYLGAESFQEWISTVIIAVAIERYCEKYSITDNPINFNDIIKDSRTLTKEQGNNFYLYPSSELKLANRHKISKSTKQLVEASTADELRKFAQLLHHVQKKIAEVQLLIETTTKKLVHKKLQK